MGHGFGPGGRLSLRRRRQRERRRRARVAIIEAVTYERQEGIGCISIVKEERSEEQWKKRMRCLVVVEREKGYVYI